MGTPQKGFFTPKFPAKYNGNPTQIVYRSSWERFIFKWADENEDVIEWQSEEFYIPYRCGTDGKLHRYFPDLKVKFRSGSVSIIEVKPASQVRKPVRTKGKKKSTFLMECFTYTKNASKWNAAEEYCKRHGYTFQIWTESVLSKLGVPTVR